MSESGPTQKPKKPILSDHQRVGRRFIPPLLQVAPIQDLSWVDSTLPELLWLGLLNNSYGLKQGAALALSLANAAVAVSASTRKRWYAPASAYSLLKEDEQIHIVRTLNSSGDLELLTTALAPLIVLYPQFPLRFLFSIPPTVNSIDEALIEFKIFLADFFNKYDQPATFVQANAIYLAFVTDILRVVEGVSLANFPAVVDFPHTDESRRVAASIYASISVFMSQFLRENSYRKYTPWSQYFWNRGLELHPLSPARL